MEKRWLCRECVAKGVRWQGWDGKRDDERDVDDEGYVPPSTAAGKRKEQQLQQLHGMASDVWVKAGRQTFCEERRKLTALT